MQCRDVEEVIQQEGLAPLPEAARAHLAGCGHCQEFFSDLAAIVSAANKLPHEVEPPPRVWVSLRTQLELEGIIKEPVAVPLDELPSWWRGFSDLFRSRALATVTVGALLLAAGILQWKYPGETQIPTPGSQSANFIEQTRKVLNEQEIDMRNMHLTSTSPVDTALQRDLQQIDDFIADCEHHLKEAPQDELAREYLYSAYQQKADLLSAMMDRGRSVN
jgi:hypothetical protein